MSFFEITGRRPLSGSLAVHAAKNSVLPILAACILAPGESVIENCPKLSDVEATIKILRGLGCRVHREGQSVWVDACAVRRGVIPEHLMHELRSSVIFLGAMLARLGEAELSYPGGCELGPRPINLHLDVLRALGADIQEEGGLLRCSAPGGLRGCTLSLSFPSVGATENAMLAACGCTGETVITGAAREPEICDLQNFLNAMGAKVEGAGSPVITVRGAPDGLVPARHKVIGDRIVAATYLACVGATGGEVELTGADPAHLDPVLDVLCAAGCRIQTQQNQINLKSDGHLHAVPPICTAPYPGFPTDAQAVIMAALAGGEGETVFEENIFQSRYRHASELARMGADIRLTSRTAVVRGTPLHSSSVSSTDLRGGAALVVAALCARGTSRVCGLHHIDRGYECLEHNLRQLGAQIERKD